MERKLTMLLLCLFFSVGAVFAQNKVTGTVVSQDDGYPVIGATVMVEVAKQEPPQTLTESLRYQCLQARNL